MNTIPIFLFAALLTLNGCGEKTSSNKAEVATSAVPAVTAKELTLEEKIAKWQKEADAGNAEAQYHLSNAYYSGTGVQKNLVKAFEWAEKSAAQGFADAQTQLGVMHANGEGILKDTAKSVEWFQKAAALGNAKAQFHLGMMYAKGEGVTKDAAKAADWYQKVANQGDANAQTLLGMMYAIGEGVPKDEAKAMEWYQKAAAQGYMSAQFFLGLRYIEKREIVRGYAWLNLASAQGFETAKKYRDEAEWQMTTAQRAEGQRLASNWKKGDILQAPGNDESGSASPDGKPIKHSTGTAFAVSNSGHALTNHHVVNGCSEVRIAGREGTAKVITSDSVNDLALLQLPGKTSDIVNLNADPSKLRQGEEIIVFGYPLNSMLSSGGNLTPGIISSLTGVENNTNQIQITAPIQSGSSGSPVMDKKGNVVGVVSGRLDMKAVRLTGSIPQNVNFAVNGQTVKSFLDANKVPYKTSGGFFSREKSNADIAEEARKWTVLVECWK